jgi:hypothetical protein
MKLLPHITILLLAYLAWQADAFLPASIESKILDKLDSHTRLSIGEISETISHEDIIGRGVLRSVARLLHDRPGGAAKITLDDIDNGVYDTSAKRLYHAFSGKWLCDIGVSRVVRDELEPQVALPDLAPATAKLASAHFDGGKDALLESSQRVADFTKRVHDALDAKDYKTARVLSAQILHTVHDFYSHSNWYLVI